MNSCYGNYRYNQIKCKECEYRAWCEQSKDLPMLSKRMYEFNDLRESGITEEKNKNEPIKLKKYNYEDLLEVIGFMVNLDIETLDFLQQKLSNPDVTFEQLGQERNISRQGVHKFIKNRCEKIPELKNIMQNRQHKNNKTKTKTFMEKVCQIKQMMSKKQSPKPANNSKFFRNLNCSNQNFDLSKMNIIKGSALFKKD